MEYLPGLNLGDLVRQCGPLPAERVIYLLSQICVALSEAHAAGLIHRDIKPANVFAAKRGGLYDVAKVLDFGLAKPLTEADSIQLTQEGTITGSPLFMSPEQATGDGEPDARSDIYSVGALAYFLLAARPPFDDQRPIKVLLAHAHEEPAPLSRLQSGVPEDLERVVLRCLAKRPEHRFQSAAEMAAALGGCAAAGRWTQEAAARWWRDHASRGAPPAEAVVFR
jgi:serine/threonine-protein kinase